MAKYMSCHAECGRTRTPKAEGVEWMKNWYCVSCSEAIAIRNRFETSTASKRNRERFARILLKAENDPTLELRSQMYLIVPNECPACSGFLAYRSDGTGVCSDCEKTYPPKKTISRA
jgi:hypothetical protein